MYNNNDQNSSSQPGQEEPRSRKLMRWVGIATSLLIVGFLLYSAFHLGRRDASEVPVIAALEGDVKTAPEGQEDTESEFEGLEVNSVLEGATPEPSDDIQLAPEPEDLSDIDPAQIDELTDEEELPEEDVDPDQDLKSEEDEDAPEAGEESLSEDEEQEETELVADDSSTVNLPVRRPELLYVQPVANVSETSNSQEDVSTQSSEAVETTASTEDSDNEVLDDVAEQIAEEIAEAETADSEESTSNGEDFGPRLTSGTPLIQLAANLDPQSTRDQWAQLQSANSDILGDKNLYIEKAVVNGTTYYRLRVQGFSSSSETRAACQALMARNVQCLAVGAQ